VSRGILAPVLPRLAFRDRVGVFEAARVRECAVKPAPLMVAGAIFLGGLIGLPRLRLGSIDVGLSLAVGALLGGLVMSCLCSASPLFGCFPASLQVIFESLGLKGFLTLLGLGSGHAVVEGLKTSGPALFFPSVIITLPPHAVALGSHARSLSGGRDVGAGPGGASGKSR